MNIVAWMTVLAYAAASGANWRLWPFSSMGYTGGFLPIVAKFVFVGVLFTLIALFLRLLFGPKGFLRGQGWETIQEARKREQASNADISIHKTRQRNSQREQS